MGLGLSFAEGEGPRFARPLRDEAAIARARRAGSGRQLRYVFDAVARDHARTRGPRAADRLRRQPVHARLLHDRGQGQRRFRDGAQDGLRAAPTCSRRSIRERPRGCRVYLDAQIEAGAEAVMIFDTLGRAAVADAYRRCFARADAPTCSRRWRRARGVPCPSIVFTKGGGAWLDEIAASGATASALDWTVDIRAARARGRRTRGAAGQSRPAGTADRPGDARARPRAVDARGRRGARPHLQPRPRHRAAARRRRTSAALVEAVHATSRESRAAA